MRYAARVDSSQDAIVAALRAAGCYVVIIEQPVDLLVRGPDPSHWEMMECKTPGYRRRTDQKTQWDFVDRFHVPIVTSPYEALLIMGLVK